jgi:hypothetical protein
MPTKAQGYARMHRQFLQNSNPQMLSSLQKSGELPAYLERIGQSAEQMYDTLEAQMMTAKDLPKDYQAKVQALEAIPLTVDEIVRSEIVNQPLPQQMQAE